MGSIKPNHTNKRPPLAAEFRLRGSFALLEKQEMWFNRLGEIGGGWLQHQRKEELVRAFNYSSSNDNPPAANPDGWIIPAGKDGKSLARPPIKVNYIGTQPAFKTDKRLSDDENKRLQALYDHRAQENEDVLKKAIFILSQSATGRHLLEEMTKEGFRISFDDRLTGSKGAGGLCDPLNKMIVLKSSHDPEYIALVLGHEAVHALQHSKYDVFPSSAHRPEAGIALSFAIEADAYAQQTQIAFELAHGDPDGPKNQLTFKRALHQMSKRFPNIVKAAEKTLGEKGALKNGALVAAAFQGFYDNPYLRTFYEDGHMEWVHSYAPRILSGFGNGRKHFTQGTNPAEIAGRLMHRGKPYLKTHAPSINLGDPRYAGVTDVTEKKLKNFYRQFRANDPVPEIKRYGVHMKNAVAWVLGLLSESSAAVIMDPPKTRKPSKPFNKQVVPLKSPRPPHHPGGWQ